MGDNPDRKSGRVPCRKGGVDRLNRNGQTPNPMRAWQVAGGTNPLMSFPLNCGQRFSLPQCSFRAQQRLGRLLVSWIRKRLCSVVVRPLMMIPNSKNDLFLGFSKGVGFVRFDLRTEAEMAIKQLNGTIPVGSSEPMTVKFANHPSSIHSIASFPAAVASYLAPARQLIAPIHTHATTGRLR